MTMKTIKKNIYNDKYPNCIGNPSQPCEIFQTPRYISSAEVAASSLVAPPVSALAGEVGYLGRGPPCWSPLRMRGGRFKRYF